MRVFDSIGVQIPQIYLPRQDVDLSRWAVIACDQFTSQPEYWKQVEEIVGNSPSTYHLILPEVFLGTPEEPQKIQTIQAKMREVLENGVLEPFEGLIYIERSVGGKTRKGLILALDLERYDYTKGSSSLIRATEGTIIERLPPRMKIREGASLELPHILVLIDDPLNTVFGPVTSAKDRLPKAYDFDLMCGSGHLTGYKIEDPANQDPIIHAIEELASPAVFRQKYQLRGEAAVLLFAMGDGNHSLATAKAIWEKLKPEVGMNHPARYALVEIENVHDDGLEFEPIHRVLFGVRSDLVEAMRAFFKDQFRLIPCRDCTEMVSRVDKQTGPSQVVGMVSPDGYQLVEIQTPTSNLPVGTLQHFLDDFLDKSGAEKIDYVHGLEVTCQLGQQAGNLGFYLPAMDKAALFKTVILDGALPRKTFSMGEAHEKRFYLESRKII